MTTPRITGTRPDRARSAAVIALLEANPDATVLVDERPYDGTNKVQQSISSALRTLSNSARGAGITTWTRKEGDVVRGYAKLRPLQSAKTILEVLTESEPDPAVEAPAAPTVKARAKSTSRSYLERLLNPLESNVLRNKSWTNLTTRRNKSGVAGYDRSNPDVASIERRRIALINYAKAHGVAIKTRVIATEKTVRLEAQVVTGS